MKNFSPGVFDQVVSHCRSAINHEVGGLLVGEFTDNAVNVMGAIPALAASEQTANVTFTHEVWDEALDAIDTDFPGLRIVGWYHSHPRFGVFMSNYDQFIQENFFLDPRMPALVIDPISGDGGVFHFIDGSVQPTDTFTIEPVSDDEQLRITKEIKRNEGKSRWLLGFPVVGLVGLLLGVVLGGGFNPPTTTLPPSPQPAPLAFVSRSISCWPRA